MTPMKIVIPVFKTLSKRSVTWGTTIDIILLILFLIILALYLISAKKTKATIEEKKRLLEENKALT